MLNRRVREAMEGGYCKQGFGGFWYYYPSNKVRLSNPKRDYFSVTGEGLGGISWFTAGGIEDRDKRKVRRALRKLGVVGKVEELVQ